MISTTVLENLGTARDHGGTGASKSSNNNNGVELEPAETATKIRPREGARAAKATNETPAMLVILIRTTVGEGGYSVPGGGRDLESPRSQGESSMCTWESALGFPQANTV